jgi:hypothetical protein
VANFTATIGAESHFVEKLPNAAENVTDPTRWARCEAKPARPAYHPRLDYW